MNKSMCVLVCVTGAIALSTGLAADVFTYSEAEKTLVADVAQNDEVTVKDGDDVVRYLADNLVTNFIKRGDGILTADFAAPTYLGDTTVEAGVYTFVTNAALGKLAGTNECGLVRVKNGATLNCNNKVANAWTWWNKCILFEGEGAPGWGGALTISGNYDISRMYFSSNLVMTADARIANRAANKTWYMTGGSYPVWLDMNGHTLTYDGWANAKMFAAGCLNVKNPGRIVVDHGTFGLLNDSTCLNGSEVNTLSFTNDGALCFSKTSGDSLGWTLDAARLSSLSVLSGYAKHSTADNYWSGPVLLGERRLTVDVADGRAARGQERIGCPVSG